MCLFVFMFMRLLLLLSSFYLIMANSNYSSASSSMQQPSMCHDSESSALLQFKQSFLINQYASSDPSAYPKVATWKSHREGEAEGSDCCSWDGVECGRETGHVIGLHLASSCLYGSINSTSTLFNLVHLRRLDLSDNHFNYSEIPIAVGKLSRLRSLALSYSHFSGQIPLEVLALSKLVFLDLSANPMLQLQKPGLRDLVQNLTHLKTLYLSQVDISSTIPHELANLPSLTHLDLNTCGMHGEFPTKIFRLLSLEYLSVWNNPDVMGYLPEFEKASPLKILYLTRTSFSGELPASIGRLGSLTRLYLNSCNFTGKIPPSLANLTALTSLALSQNNFSVGTLSWLGQLTKLTLLSLSYTNLKGEIPFSLVNMNQLTYLNLEGNRLSGEIPFSLVNMSQLTYLNLDANQLSGQIPSWLMNLTQLTSLSLAGNELEGSIPNSLFELVNLQFLALSSNYLNGTFDTDMLSKLKNLNNLQLDRNGLSWLSYNNGSNVTFPKFNILGLSYCNLTEFPNFLRNQNNVKFLTLSGNNIHGPVPTWMWNISRDTIEALHLAGNFLTRFDQLPVVLPWSRLFKLELDFNMLQGPLPIPPPSTFQYSVSHNKLTGEISPLICNMTSLMTLDLSSNNLGGRIPPCLANISKSLLVLNLGRNNFNGPIPQTCTAPNILRVIDLGENQFQGQLPRSLANCVMLEHLVLNNNQIGDSFPFWLGALPQLQVLILRSNRFHGEIGSWHITFKFPKLHVIDLSDNEFTGDLPSEYFENWDAMKLTNVSNAFWYMQANSTFQVPGYSMNFFYKYSMTITNKGMQTIYEKVPKILTAIDFSSNNFRGQIPMSIGNLKGLHLLNLGNNNLTGHIPYSLGNLTRLESLDLSQNKLSGEIPWQLTGMTFLEFFNVSYNNLTGPIPQGNQFPAFPNTSFDGNPGLCGIPLSRACGSSEASPPTPSSSKQVSIGEFDWKLVLMGYGSGLVIGVSIGYHLTSWKHEWFVKTFGKQQRKWTGTERMGLRS